MNTMWRLGTGHGIAYVESRDLALGLIRDGLTKHRTLEGAMAVYYTRRGRAFAWQLLFPTERWDGVATILGDEPETPGAEPSPDGPAAAAPAAGEASAAARPRARREAVGPSSAGPAKGARTRAKRTAAAVTPAANRSAGSS
ncbi:MAG: hypothetical protein HY321_00320 [Armatimonadetes bacterium]|nr:hypothetical protein [Armatimonadota bacterium]